MLDLSSITSVRDSGPQFLRLALVDVVRILILLRTLWWETQGRSLAVPLLTVKYSCQSGDSLELFLLREFRRHVSVGEDIRSST